MTKNKTNTPSRRARIESTRTAASPDVMMRATQAANASQTQGYYYGGSPGDNVSMRLGSGGGGGLGGGNDSYDGMFGANQTWDAQGFGNYFGTGLLNNVGRMNGGASMGGAHGSSGFTYLKRFSSQSAFNHQIIAQCMLAYLGYGVVRNIIDLYADFATEGIQIFHPQESVNNFYNAWAKKVNLKNRIHDMFLNLFVSGQTFVHRGYATLEPGEKRAMKRASGADVINGALVCRGKTKDTEIKADLSQQIDNFLSKKEIYLNQTEGATSTMPDSQEEKEGADNKDKRIPWSYTYLNPLQMEIRGSKVRGKHYWVMGIDKQDTLEIAEGYGMSSRQELGTTEINLPEEFVSRVQNYQGNGVGYNAEVRLSKEELTVVQAPGKWDWFDWAVPFVFPSLRALTFKDCLRGMEMRACQQVINSIFLFKLGALKDGFPAEDEHFERFTQMLQMPAQAMNIIWNDLIDAEVIQADVKGLFDTKKHESADKDILTALGVPEVLLGGKGGNFSNSFIAVAGVLEKLESYRDVVHHWLMGEVKVIADAMGFQKLPDIRFGNTSLRDEKSQQTFMLALYDRNVLSVDTLLEEANTTVDIEEARLEKDKKRRAKDVFEPRGPFVKDPKPAPGTPGAPGVKPGGTKPNGRPPGSDTGPTGKQSNPKAPTGQGVADILELQDKLQANGRILMDRIEAFCSQGLIRARARENSQLKNMKQLHRQDRERLESLIYNVFSHADPVDEVNYTDDFIMNMLRSPATHNVKADVLEIYSTKLAEYSRDFGKLPGREQRRKIMVSAWTQRAIVEHLGEKTIDFKDI